MGEGLTELGGCPPEEDRHTLVEEATAGQDVISPVDYEEFSRKPQVLSNDINNITQIYE